MALHFAILSYLPKENLLRLSYCDDAQAKPPFRSLESYYVKGSNDFVLRRNTANITSQRIQTMSNLSMINRYEYSSIS